MDELFQGELFDLGTLICRRTIAGRTVQFVDELFDYGTFSRVRVRAI
jgi:hypothetical protein